ncbi:hypothetical protein DDR33_24975 [Pararcticibacter amylolyticus]|uniref:Uncharacterized protein n=1 Tax=Pararcticibacter amylolyticus TaxID=2173175 RepID=A0A2U2P972_9SPHI|nr:hypothetical protein DDR33_24975 [Pararcticibacter amylolyticus]
MWLDFLIFITHRFLVIFKKINEHDLKGRCVNAVTLMLFFICLLIITSIYLFLIKIDVLIFNKVAYFISCALLFLIVSTLVKRRYKPRYESVINRLGERFQYKKRTYILLFILFWFVPLFSFWGGLLLVRNLLY